MSRLEEQLNEQFRRWELRGRGWAVFDIPVSPEPPFVPFRSHYLPPTHAPDDGRRPTFFSSFAQKLSRKLNTAPPSEPVPAEPEEEPEPEPLVRETLVELQTSLPADLDIPKEAFEQLLRNLALCREPIAFELIGTAGRVGVQFAAGPDDAPLVRRQLHSYFPEAVFQQHEGTLEKAWDACTGEETLVVEFGLTREFMFPLASGKLDPFIGIVGALSELQPADLGLFQVLFQPVEAPWAESIVNSVTHDDGKPFFVNLPELASAAENKVKRPLYAAVVRIAVKSESYDHTVQIARDLAGSLRAFAAPQGNELIPLENSDYPFEEHIDDVLRRQSRRSGMVLNSDELTGFVHLPSSAVRSPVLERETGKTKAAPAIVRGNAGVLLGHNLHAKESHPVRLTPEQRVQHMHVIGVQGTGKSTLLFNLIRQDIENGEGVGVLDPHGDLIDQILGIIPPDRVNDVVLVDPSDEEYSVGFNILSAHSDLEKTLLASDLVSVFERLSTSWGDQMASVLKNAILAFLESSEGGTLSDLRRFLIEPAFREKFLKTVADPDIVYYWKRGFTQLSGNKSIGPVITRLNDFLAPKPIRYMVSQKVNRLDFGHILDSGKIFLARLSHGQMGKENSFLLGSLFVAKIQQLVMARQAQQASVRRDFWLYIDEFHNIITPSVAEILAGARKYRLGFTLAHQELRQLERDRDVQSAVLSNPYTRVIFRVGDGDARVLENGFSFFEAKDLQNSDKGRAICRVERADWDFNLVVPLPEAVGPETARATRQSVVAASRAKYAIPRAEVQVAERAKLDADDGVAEAPKATPPPPLLPKVAEPNPPEVWKSTASEEAMPPVVAPAEATSAPPNTPLGSETVAEGAARGSISEQAITSDLGRGGTQHRAIQKRIKQAAEALGFRSGIEKEVLDGKGSVDLLLERAGQSIACEISITTTVDHEVGNITKCLRAGATTVAVICISEERLQKIQNAVSGSLGPEAARLVVYYLPDRFLEYLQTLPQIASRTPGAERTRRGYKVKSSISTLAPEQQKQQEDAAIRAIAETMRKKAG
jgi:hypothetical protein